MRGGGFQKIIKAGEGLGKGVVRFRKGRQCITSMHLPSYAVREKII